MVTFGTGTEVLTWLDDHSRLALSVTAHARVTGPIVLAFRAAIASYGAPAPALTGPCSPGGSSSPGLRWCCSSGSAGRTASPSGSPGPRPPTTTGKIERLHQSLQIELLDDHGRFDSIEALQAALDSWREEYNTDRPHQSLNMASRSPGSLRLTRRWNCGCRRS